jgi:hypothetical protein
MKLQLLPGNHVKAPQPGPTIYKCKIVSNETGFARFMWYVGPYARVPRGWHIAVRIAK